MFMNLDLLKHLLTPKMMYLITNFVRVNCCKLFVHFAKFQRGRIGCEIIFSFDHKHLAFLSSEGVLVFGNRVYVHKHGFVV